MSSDISDLGFNAAEVEPAGAIIPNGEYVAVCVSGERKKTSDATGEYLALQFQIVAGPYQNRKITVRLNLWNQNAMAQQIARGQFSSLCRAIGVLTPKNTVEILGKPVIVKVVIRKGSGEYAESNEIRDFKTFQAVGPVVNPHAGPLHAGPLPPQQQFAPQPVNPVFTQPVPVNPLFSVPQNYNQVAESLNQPQPQPQPAQQAAAQQPAQQAAQQQQEPARMFGPHA